MAAASSSKQLQQHRLETRCEAPKIVAELSRPSLAESTLPKQSNIKWAGSSFTKRGQYLCCSALLHGLLFVVAKHYLAWRVWCLADQPHDVNPKAPSAGAGGSLAGHPFQTAKGPKEPIFSRETHTNVASIPKEGIISARWVHGALMSGQNTL